MINVSTILAQDKTIKDNLNCIDPNVHFGVLDNGFKYYLYKIKLPSNHIEMRLVVKAGDINEENDQIGLAHFLEHMAFNGTKNFPGNTMMDLFDKQGLKRGINWNGHTGFKKTTYELKIPSNNPELFSQSLLLLRDWSQDMTLDTIEIDKERGVVLGEFLLSNTYSNRKRREIISKLLDSPKYSFDLGSAVRDENIGIFNYKSLVRFYEDWYLPNRQAVIIVGDINVDEIKKRIELLFSDMTIPEIEEKNEVSENEYSVILTGRNKFISITDIEKPSFSIDIYKKKEAKPNVIINSKDLKKPLLDAIFNEILRTRMKNLSTVHQDSSSDISIKLERNAILYKAKIDALHFKFSTDDVGSIKTNFQFCLSEMERICQFGFLESELSGAKKAVLSKITVINPKNESMEIFRKLENNFINGELILSKDQEYNLSREYIEQITLSEINLFSKQWCDLDLDTDIVFTSPSSTLKNLPDKNSFIKWKEELKNISLFQYKDNVNDKIDQLVNIEDLKDERNSMLNKIFNDELHLYELTFANNIKVILKPISKPQGLMADRVGFNGFRPGGASRYPPTRHNEARLIGEIVCASGIGHYSKVQLDDYLLSSSPSNLANLSIDIGNEYTSLSGSCRPDNIEIMLQLIYLSFDTPKYDEQAFELWKKNKERLIKKQKLELDNAMSDTISKILFNSEASIKNLDLNNIDYKEAYKIYQEEFSSANGFTLAFVGDFNPNKLIPLITKYIGALPSKPMNQNISNFNVESKVLPKKLNKVIYLGSNKSANVSLFFTGEYTESLKNRIKLDLITEGLKLKMWERLREAEGGTYGVGVNVFSTQNNLNYYRFGIGFYCAVDNVDHMINSTIDELNKIKTSGFDQDFFSAAKEQLLATYLKDLNEITFWSYQLERKYKDDNDFDLSDILKKISILQLIDKDEINKAIKLYLNEENLLRFVQYPENFNN